MHFYTSKSTPDSLISVINAFKRKPSLGTPECIIDRYLFMKTYKMCASKTVLEDFLISDFKIDQLFFAWPILVH